MGGLLNSRQVLAGLFACWAGLVVVNYAADPLHRFRFANVYDGAARWARAPVSLNRVMIEVPAHARAAAGAGLLVAAAWLAGWTPAAWTGGVAGRAFAAPLALGLGMGAVSLSLFGLGLAGLYRPAVFYPLTAAMAVAGALKRRRRRRSAAEGAEGFGRVSRSVVRVTALLAAVSAAVGMLGALAPETAYDSLIQHLADPRDHLSAGRIFFNDLSFLAQHPALMQMLYGWLLPAGGESAAKVFHAMIAVAGAWTFWHYARLRFSPSTAFLLACVLYLTPFNGILSTRAYVDHGLVFFSAAALLAPWGSWAQGAMIGLAIGSKYLGGFLLVSWAAAMLVCGRGETRWSRTWRVAAAASAAAGWWGVRNWLNTGNPVFPFGFGFFGGLGWDAHSAVEYGRELASYGSVQGVVGYLTIPWRVTVRDLGALDDGSLGPLYLALVPLLLLRRGGSRVLPVVVGALWLLWLFSPRQVRYALMLLPPTLALLAEAGARAREEWPELVRRTVPLLPAVLYIQLLVSLAAVYLWVNPIYVVSGIESPFNYLSRIMEPRDRGTGRSLYMSLVDRLPFVTPPGAKTYMLGDAKVHYLPGRWRVNALFNPPLLARALRESATPDGVARKIRQRGITHVLYNVGGSIHIEFTHRMFHPGEREQALLEEFARAWLRPIARYDDSDGEMMYVLFELKPGKYPYPDYLPGLDTRIAGVESAALAGKAEAAREAADELLREYPSSKWLPGRLKAALKLGQR